MTGGTTGFGRYWIVAPLGGDCVRKRRGQIPKVKGHIERKSRIATAITIFR